MKALISLIRNLIDGDSKDNEDEEGDEMHPENNNPGEPDNPGGRLRNLLEFND